MGIFVVMLIALDDFRGSLFFASTSVLRATKSFHTRPYNRQILRRKPDVSHKERNSLTFFNFLYMVRTVSLWNHHQTTVSYPVKNSSTFKISPICCHQPTKKPFCYNSDKCWVVNLKNITGESSPKSFSPPSVKRRWSQLFLTSRQQSARTFWLPLKISLFSNSQSKNSKLIRKSYVPRALRFSCQGSAG